MSQASRWDHLQSGRDEGGPRWFLAGRPVHAGTGLHLRLPGGQEAEVRFEQRFGDPVLYLATGRDPWWDDDYEEWRDDGPQLVCQPSTSWARIELRWPDEPREEPGLMTPSEAEAGVPLARRVD